MLLFVNWRITWACFSPFQTICLLQVLVFYHLITKFYWGWDSNLVPILNTPSAQRTVQMFSIVFCCVCPTFKFPLVVKAFPHTEHLKGRSPVWVRMWICRADPDEKFFLQTWHKCLSAELLRTGSSEKPATHQRTPATRKLWAVVHLMVPQLVDRKGGVVSLKI